jgi:hypothetical protein
MNIAVRVGTWDLYSLDFFVLPIVRMILVIATSLIWDTVIELHVRAYLLGRTWTQLLHWPSTYIRTCLAQCVHEYLAGSACTRPLTCTSSLSSTCKYFT